jgi:hypothetical protein
MNAMWKVALTLCCCLATGIARAEDDGEELLHFMRTSASAKTAQPFIDDVVARWNKSAFCIPDANTRQLSFDAVKLYLESNPSELYRQRRYLIIQGLRAAFPCPNERK